MNISIRRATENDKDFLITSILEAEKSGSEIISKCAIFSISEEQLCELIVQILDENIEGQEFCISNFLIAEVNGEQAASISAWVETESGMSSNMIKSNLYMYFLGKDAIFNSLESLAVVNETEINRDEGALQIECVYTAEKYRGLGLTKLLINEHIKLQKDRNLSLNKAQIVLFKNNISAINAYQKAGFDIVEEKESTNEAILKLQSFNTRILMERNLINN